MSSTQDKLRRIENAERLRVIGNWLLGSGGVAMLLILTVVGVPAMANPEAWLSLHMAMVGEGMLRWLIAPLFALGLALLIAGAWARALAAKGHGEV